MLALDPCYMSPCERRQPGAVWTEWSELRLVLAACLIEMHYRSASPAGRESAAIVHSLTAIGPTRIGTLFNREQGPSQ